MTMKDPMVYLAHARDCVAKILRFAAEGEHVFLHDDKTHDAILRNLEIIGQCVKDAGIEPLEEQHPEIPWRTIAAFRNILAHAYLSVNPAMVWEVIQNSLPSLQATLNNILENWEA